MPARSRIAVVGVLSLSAALIASCHDGTAPKLEPCDAETNRATATVDVGAAVRIRWSPACLATGLAVYDGSVDTSGAQLAWRLDARDSGLATPVRYGEAPAGVTTASAPLPLVRGHLYVVLVFSHDRLQGGEQTYTYTRFTP